MSDINNSQHNQADIETEEFVLLEERLSNSRKGPAHFASPCEIPKTICRRAELKNLDIQLALDSVQDFMDKFKAEFETTPPELEKAAAILNFLVLRDNRKTVQGV